MKNVPLVRNHVISYLVRLRTFVSCLPDNLEAVDRLRGPEGDERAARIVAFILNELGHAEGEGAVKGKVRRDAETKSEDTQVKRAVSRALGA